MSTTTEAALDQLELLLKKSTNTNHLRPHSTGGSIPTNLKPRSKLSGVDQLSSNKSTVDTTTNRPRAPIVSRRRRERKSLSNSESSPGLRSRKYKTSGDNDNDNGRRRSRNQHSSQRRGRRHAKARESKEKQERLQNISKTPERRISSSMLSRDARQTTTQSDTNFSGVHFLNVESTSYETQGESEVFTLHTNQDDQSNHKKSPQDNTTTTTSPTMFERRDIIESNNNKKGYATICHSDGFVIPELPSGKQLTINILSTWGDAFYVGLMGIELFDSSGHRIQIQPKYVTADPPDINILEEYTNDPRICQNLFDGINHTTDDLHAWLAPYNQGDNHFIFVDLDGSQSVKCGNGSESGNGSRSGSRRRSSNKTSNNSNEPNEHNEQNEHNEHNEKNGKKKDDICISMMRIWNYNKSRIHSYRGARYVEIKLDNRFIFKGEIQRAPGAMLGSTACAECLLFTNNSSILKIIERYDKEPEGRDKYQHRVVGWDDQIGLNGNETETMTRIGTGISGGHNKNGGISSMDADWKHGWGDSSNASNENGIRVDRVDSPPKFFNPAGLYNRPNTADSKRSRGFDDGIKGMGDVERNKGSERSEGSESDTNVGSDLKIVSSTKKLNVRNASSSSTTTKTTRKTERTVIEDDTLSALNAGRKEIQPATRRKRKPVRPKTAPMNRDGSISTPHVGRVLEMELISNWGDKDGIGMTAFQVMNAAFQPIPIQSEMLQLFTSTDSLNSSNSSHSQMSQVRSQQMYHLIDEETTTTDVNHMWCMNSLPKGTRYRLVIDFTTNVSILGLVVWNYNGNANVEETYRGVKRMKILLDGIEKSPPFLGTLVRKAPGSSSFNFGQFINLNIANVPERTPKKHYDSTHVVQQQQRQQQQQQQQQLQQQQNSNRLIRPQHGGSRSSSREKVTDAMKPTQQTTERTLSVSVSKNMKKGNHSKTNVAQDTQDWGWSNNTSGGGSFARREVEHNFKNRSTSSTSGTAITTVSNNLQHQTTSDGLTLTEERDGEINIDFDGDVRQQYETPTLPTGCIFKFILLSTHGDPHYIGLNGLELYDEYNIKIELDETNVEAVPRDINDLSFVVQSGETDIRTVDKLYSGINTSYLDEHMWLAPYQSDRANFIYVFLDQPVTISRIVLYNYTKTPTRGVLDIEVLFDDVLVYRGQLRKAISEVETRRTASHNAIALTALKCSNNGNSILFTKDITIIKEEIQRNRIFNPDDNQCLFINNGEVDESQAPNKNRILATRPTTSARSRRSGAAAGGGGGREGTTAENIGEL